jgi:hypothetical protein
MFALEESDPTDYLFLFESLQDVAEFDSSVAPSNARIYQVKKKDRGEWTWSELTGVPAITSKTAKEASVDKVAESILGKLCADVAELAVPQTKGIFISDAGCSIPLEDETNAATKEHFTLADLKENHRIALIDAFRKIHGGGTPTLADLQVEKSPFRPDGMEMHIIGVVHCFLSKRSPRHVSQAKTLVDGLIGKISPLGRKTGTCGTFTELRHKRGFSRQQFSEAVTSLETIPDIALLTDEWVAALAAEGMPLADVTRLRIELGKVAIERLARSPVDSLLLNEVAAWVSENSANLTTVRPFLESGLMALKDSLAHCSKHRIFAHLVLEGISVCVAQTTEN